MKVFALAFLAAITAVGICSEVLQGFSSANNQFSTDVYKVLKQTEEGNFVVCPLSVEVLLALIHAGAGGKTAQELSIALHLPQSRNTIDSIYREVHLALQADQDYILRSANKAYIEDKYSVKPEYKSTVVKTFGAEIENIDFGQKSVAASKINKWVSDRTDGKITKLVSDDDFTDALRFVLVNAIYFEGKWVYKFQKDSTSLQPFYITKTSYINVDLMEQTNYFRYYYSKKFDAKYLELPYKGENITMTIILPGKIGGLSGLEDKLHEVIEEVDYSTSYINLKLPKNKLETSIQFKPILEKLGIVDVFTPVADLTKLLDKSGEPLYISKIVQKALIKTDEEGTIAAAASAGFGVTYSAHITPEVINFHADRPYVFFLKHKDAGILFIGRYSTPGGDIVKLDHPVDD